MVLPILAPATITLIAGIVRLIAWLSSIVFVGMYVRDAVTKVKEADVAISTNDTVDGIISNPNMTPAQKEVALKAFLDGIKTNDWQTTALYAVGILAAAYIVSTYLQSRPQRRVTR